jgi:thymidylate kinase
MTGGVFCVVLGADGAGKTTLLGNMASREPGWEYVSARPEDLYPIEGLDCYDWALRNHPREYVLRMRPLTRAAFYISTLAVEYEYHIAPALQAGRTVICDSYWYRFLAKEQVLNPRGGALLRHLPEHLPRPDLVLWLDVPLDSVWRRSREVTLFEVDGEISWTGFEALQRAVLQRAQAMVNRDRLAEIRLDARTGPERLADEAIAAVAGFAERRVRAVPERQSVK